ncbi:MAG: sigma-70 family RNA polymerase sigma factor [Candidatus Roizmanbacteria bacterium]
MNHSHTIDDCKKNKEYEQVQLILGKDESEILRFYKTYNKSVFRLVYKQIPDKQKAEEIMHDVFLDFIEALRDFYFQCSLKTYLFSIARHKIIDAIRRKKIKHIFFSHLPSYIVDGLKVVFIEDEIEQKEITEKINTVMSSLPNEYEVVLRLKYIDGARVKHIAEKMSLGFKATESLIFRARQAFIKAFQSEG